MIVVMPKPLYENVFSYGALRERATFQFKNQKLFIDAGELFWVMLFF